MFPLLLLKRRLVYIHAMNMIMTGLVLGNDGSDGIGWFDFSAS
jgi:hypothetical protein